ncbi:MAG TPA: hypothetical protein VE174_00770 [Actinomycetota bacterium]|nr:hypothetical protein [Actinomycetota bacterium]
MRLLTRLCQVLLFAVLVALPACTGGINAGGESPTNNGGVAFIALAGMLILSVIILWIILGRDE